MNVQYDAPLFNTLINYKSSEPDIMHMPGHKMGRGLPDIFKDNMPYIDVTEIDGTDNLHFPEGSIKLAQEMAAKAFGAKKTYFLVNGSTCGILAIINSVCQQGDTLIVGRDCHISVINAMMLAGTNPIFVHPAFNNKFRLNTVIDPENIRQAIEDNLSCKGVFVTSPNYFGICSDIESISKIVSEYGKILIVDEAHGAHLCYSQKLPKCSMQQGADICVQSAHKTLPAINQGAFVHINSSKIDIDRLEFYLRVFQTTSPSYIIMASLDIARSIMQHEGRIKLDKLINHINSFEDLIMRKTRFKLLRKGDLTHGDKDITRIVVNTTESNIRGYVVDLELKNKYNIYSECVYFDNIVFISTIADDREIFVRLAKALIEIFNDKHVINSKSVRNSEHVSNIVEKFCPVVLPRLDFSKTREIELTKAAGEKAATNIIPYPPGIPALICGDKITDDIINIIISYIKEGMTVNGLRDNTYIRVMEDKCQKVYL